MQPERFAGKAALPADKSVAHRAALFAALAHGPSRIHNYPSSADPQSTLACLRQLGVRIETPKNNTIIVYGVGNAGLRRPTEPLDCGNSGTTMRLLAGILAGQPFESTLVGDASLSRRPMRRIADPLRAMGARIELTDSHAPIHIRPTRQLRGITYRLPVPSAQVKSCVLLAGLWADGQTTVVETIASRDHTERMLALPVAEHAGERRITSSAQCAVTTRTWSLPGDFSAAAFLLVAGSVAGTGPLALGCVGLNPSRTGLLPVLQAMGADITIHHARTAGVEPVGDLTVRPAKLRAVTVDGSTIANLIDEVPVLAVAATCAHGTTVIRDAAELRVKECDRIRAMVVNLRALGADVEEFEDGLAVTGGRRLMGTGVEVFDDHRIAMALGVAGLVAGGDTIVRGAEAASVSFPNFWTTLKELAA